MQAHERVSTTSCKIQATSNYNFSRTNGQCWLLNFRLTCEQISMHLNLFDDSDYLGIILLFKMGLGSYFVCITKTASNKLGPWFVLCSFFLQFDYLNLLDKLNKRVCRAFDPTLTISLESFAHHQHQSILCCFFLVVLLL